MARKKRIYDLAKEYGMSGQDLAKKLRDLGFSQVKSHMTALDEFEVLQVQGVLEAHGVIAESSRQAPEAPGGLVLRRKKKVRAPERGPESPSETPSESPSESDDDGPDAEEAAAPSAPADESAGGPFAEQTAEAGPAPAKRAAPEHEAEGVGGPYAEEAPGAETPTAESHSTGTPGAQAPSQRAPADEAPAASPSAEAPTQAPKETAEAPSAEATPPADAPPAEAARAAEAPAPEQRAPESAPQAPAAQTPPAQTPAEQTPAAEAPQTPAAQTPSAQTPAAQAPRAQPADEAAPEASAKPAEAASEGTSAQQPASAQTSGAQTAGAEAQGKAEGQPAAPEKAAAGGAAAGASPSAEKAPAEAADDVVRPAKPQRMGKVVGFIDLSKIQSTAKKPESRRLRSRDDVAPDVQPTMSRDRRKALNRADHGARGQLSASQLREREAGRFLRRSGGRTGPGGPGGGRGGGRGRGGRRDESLGSPYSGSTVRIGQPITIKKLAETLSIKANQLLKTAWAQLGFGAVNITSSLDDDTAALLANEYDVELEIEQVVEAEDALVDELRKKRDEVSEEKLAHRPPTVAFLGHVDHGKTTLIDSIRKSRLAERESGGITQHIGAYQVQTQAGHTITILDTPGHAAFTAMRSRGARAVDIVVLVVAADDGVKPQTEEAIAHARAAGTPIVVALNKIDKPEANPQKAMEQLASLDLIPEDWGGESAMLKVSGETGQGLEELLERVFLESEVLELRSHPTGPAAGVVIEAEVQQGKGIVAHLLVKDGTLNTGDIILAGEGYGKVRSMHDDLGRTVMTAGPSQPIEVSGLSALPGVGDSFYVVEDLARAKEVAEERERKNREMSLTERRKFDAASLFQAVADQAKETINLILRADVQGSVEVLRGALGELEHEEVEVRVLQAGVGAVTESDVLLGSTSTALIIAFRVGVNDKARQAAERAGIEIRNYDVIYNVLDDVRDLMEGALSPEVSEAVTGHIEIRRLFKSSRIGLIAGCYVLDGTVHRDHKVRLLRDGAVVYTGALASLKREKDDVREIREGFECGVVLRNFQDIREGDVIEAYKIVETRRTLEGRPKD